MNLGSYYETKIMIRWQRFPHDNGISMFFENLTPDINICKIGLKHGCSMTSSMVGLSQVLVVHTGLGFLVKPTSQLCCRSPTVRCWAVCSAHNPPPPPPPTSLDGHSLSLSLSGLQRPTTRHCHHQGWVGWDGKQGDGLGKDMSLGGWCIGQMVGWTHGWTAASNGHCQCWALHGSWKDRQRCLFYHISKGSHREKKSQEAMDISHKADDCQPAKVADLACLIYDSPSTLDYRAPS